MVQRKPMRQHHRQSLPALFEENRFSVHIRFDHEFSISKPAHTLSSLWRLDNVPNGPLFLYDTRCGFFDIHAQAGFDSVQVDVGSDGITILDDIHGTRDNSDIEVF